MLYKNILTPQIQVGAIAGQNRDYDPKKWWVYKCWCADSHCLSDRYLCTLFESNRLKSMSESTSAELNVGSQER
ncbi:MAG: hypothetical protein KME60_31340 [Cyanomargarita calcarea GSE-NOS-MK-12-04C]|uniref:Uncharacterized protein n=1 Tax=Cyanomargarita calcarea GSE-NOS-MK-12-04C TaxID=2839659 RepID=A0A951QWE0_9CYAN|nr:hypothetical protein [Cyanomargarita calcarea GSE-NOS-MK-12-04C]